MGYRPEIQSHLVVKPFCRILKGRGTRWLFGIMLLFLAVAGVVDQLGRRDRPHSRNPGGRPPTPGLDTEQNRMELLKELQHAQLWVEPSTAPRNQDWPQFRGPLRDGVVRGVNLVPDWSVRKPQILWQQPCGRGFSSVSVADGRVVILDRPKGENCERIVCFDATSGDQLWALSYPANYAKLPGTGPNAGPLATPTVYDGRLYAVGALGRLTCLELDPKGDRPTVAWEHDLIETFDGDLPDWGMAASPLVVDDLVIVQPGGSRGSIAAFDRLTGALCWASLDDGNGYTSPMLAEAGGVRQVIALTGGRLVGLRLETGEFLWHYVWRTSMALPQVSGHYVFITCEHGEEYGCALVKLQSADNTVKVRQVFACGGKLLASHISTPVIKDGYVYGFHGSISHQRGAKLTCVDLCDPSGPRWQTDEIVNGQLLRFGDLLVVQTQDGHLFLVEATPVGFRLLGEMRGLLDGRQAWAPPAAAGNRIYLRDHEKVVCVELPVTNP